MNRNAKENIFLAQSMVVDARRRGLEPNGFVLGIKIIEQFNTEVEKWYMSQEDIKYPVPYENIPHTLFGLPVTEDLRNKETIRLTFEEFSIS